MSAPLTDALLAEMEASAGWGMRLDAYNVRMAVAEIRALRAEVERLRELLALPVKWAGPWVGSASPDQIAKAQPSTQEVQAWVIDARAALKGGE